MRKWNLVFCFLALLSFASISAFSQSPTASPTPPTNNDVVKISTRLIQIDVTVVDQKGKVITDLRPDEVEIFENGIKQEISNFSFVSSLNSVLVKPNVNVSGIAIPPTALRPDNVRRTFALVVDDLSLSFESAYQTRRALKNFVAEQMQLGDLVAIVRTGAGVGALQQFTSDKRVLEAAIERVRWNPQGTGGIGAFAPIESAPDISLRESGDETDDTEPAAAGSNTPQSLDDFRSSVFATGTLGALKYIVNGMGELPGRKSVILFSDGFKLFETDASGFSDSGRVLDFLEQLVDAANRASVVFYTIDARGLAFTGFTTADSVTDTSADAINSALAARRDQLFDTQEGLVLLAEQTGGFAVKNNNDLAGGVKRILEDQSYYLIGYEPADETFDAAKRQFNKLEVKVARKGAEVRYRSGFINLASDNERRKLATQTPAVQLQNALTSPFGESGIDLRLNALFGNDASTGSYVRSLLHINARDIKFTDEKDGTKKGVIEVLAASFGDNGQPVENIGTTYVLTAKPDGYRKIIDEGFVYYFTFPVKKPGAYQYRVAVRDAQGNNIGSASQFIEIPDLKKGRLTLSSLVIENLSLEQWSKLVDPQGGVVARSANTDTALRRAKMGSIFRYGYEIYNAKGTAAKPPVLNAKIRVFRDGELVLEGKDAAVELRGQKDPKRIRSSGAIRLGGQITPGDYILQIIITDKAAAKRNTATQYVRFEVVR